MTPAERFQQLIGTAEVRQNLRHRSVRAALVTAASGFADFAIRIGSTAFLARLVLPEHFGLIMMVAAVIAIADQLRELGLSSATVQRASITHAEVSNLFWVNVGVSGALTLAICAASPWIAAYYHEPRLATITCLLATTLLFGGLTVQHQALLTRVLKLNETAAVRLFSSVVSTVLAIALAWYDFGYWALLWREVSRAALLAAGMWWCFRWVPGLPSRQTDIRSLLGFGASLTGANILGAITAGFDRFLLGRVWGASPVAHYRQSYQLITAPTDQLLSPLYQVTQPALSMLQDDPARYRRYYLKLLLLVGTITMPLSLFVAVYADSITAVVLGPVWLQSASILCLLAFGTFIKQSVGSTAFILITRGRSRTYLGLTMLHNAVLVATMCVGVRWGIEGIALAEVATTFLLIAPRLRYSLRESPVDLSAFVSGLSRPAFASLAMSFALLAFRSAGPAFSTNLDLLAGSVVAAFSFGIAWLLIPGGRSELSALWSDLRGAIRKKSSPPAPAGAVAATT
jgi:O-antigen/teichoic acid export membrane protein